MKNMYLFVILHLMIASVLGLVVMAICLFFDFVSAPAILGSFAAGFFLAIPFAWMVIRKIAA